MVSSRRVNQLWTTSPDTPITVNQGPSCASLKRLPSGSSSGQYRRASDAQTTATCTVSVRSVSSNHRPRSSGIFIALK